MQSLQMLATGSNTETPTLPHRSTSFILHFQVVHCRLSLHAWHSKLLQKVASFRHRAAHFKLMLGMAHQTATRGHKLHSSCGTLPTATPLTHCCERGIVNCKCGQNLQFVRAGRSLDVQKPPSGNMLKAVILAGTNNVVYSWICYYCKITSLGVILILKYQCWQRETGWLAVWATIDNNCSPPPCSYWQTKPCYMFLLQVDILNSRQLPFYYPWYCIFMLLIVCWVSAYFKQRQTRISPGVVQESSIVAWKWLHI